MCVFLFEKVNTIFALDLGSACKMMQHVNSFFTDIAHAMLRLGKFLLELNTSHDGFLLQPHLLACCSSLGIILSCDYAYGMSVNIVQNTFGHQFSLLLILEAAKHQQIEQ